MPKGMNSSSKPAEFSPRRWPNSATAPSGETVPVEQRHAVCKGAIPHTHRNGLKHVTAMIGYPCCETARRSLLFVVQLGVLNGEARDYNVWRALGPCWRRGRGKQSASSFLRRRKTARQKGEIRAIWRLITARKKPERSLLNTAKAKREEQEGEDEKGCDARERVACVQRVACVHARRARVRGESVRARAPLSRLGARSADLLLVLAPSDWATAPGQKEARSTP
eukprot:492817-Pleurochrysis_carterae.AAC.1